MKNNFPQKAVILAGGKGTRLYPVTKEIPKPLLPVNKKPIINYLVDLFFSQGIKEIAVLINKEFSEDFEWWGKRYYPSASSGQASSASSGQASSAGASTELSRMSSGQVPKIRFVQETEPLGTFGGLYFLKNWLAGEPFFFTNGDELKKIDLVEMAKFHEKIKPTATIALVKVPDPQNYGVVICKNGLVEDFIEKPKDPPSKYINSGLYLFSSEVFKYHPGPKFLMAETDLFPKLAKERKLAGFKPSTKSGARWTDCGTWQRYENALNKWNS